MPVFYRTYRPQKLSDLVGQEHVKEALSRALTSGKVAHAYLFSGPKGLGKTTCARILAKAVNCYDYRLPTTDYRKKKKSSSPKAVVSQQTYGEPCNRCDSCLALVEGRHLDLIEIDAASNRGIDDIRELREKIKLAPTSAPYKIYIIDEAHSLTTDAFNALLKTLEEPPEHAIFILCTTEAGKLPATIVSRCVRFDFNRATNDQLVENLAKIAKAEKIEIEEGVLERIANAGDGSFRDGLSILEQLAAGREKINQEILDEVLLSSKDKDLFDFIDFLKDGNKKDAIILINQKAKRGDDFRVYLNQIIEVLRLTLLTKTGVGEGYVEAQDPDRQAKIARLAKTWGEIEIIRLVKALAQATAEIKSAVLPQLPLELAVVELTREKPIVSDIKDKDKDKETPVGEVALKTESKPSSDESTRRLTPKSTGESASKSAGPATIHRQASSGKVEEIIKIWPQILATVKKQNFSVEALLRSTRPAKFDGRTLTLEVFYRFHKDRLEDPKTERILVSALDNLLGRQVMVNCILGDRSKRETSKTKTDEPTEDLAQAIAEIFTN